jgi:predicted transcriptional regulator YheO
MKDEELLNLYLPMVKFLAELCGPSSEVLLHNVKDPENSVIAIENGYHSGRGIGSPLTDFAIETINSGIYRDHDFISNYNGSSKGREFLSSTFFIKNEGRLIGMLCINRDLSLATDVTGAFRRLLKQYNLLSTDTEIRETLEIPADEKLKDMVAKTLDDLRVDPARMKKRDRICAIQKLKENGIFEMKGSVIEVAKQLDMSVPSIYRYLKNAQEEEQE